MVRRHIWYKGHLVQRYGSFDWLISKEFLNRRRIFWRELLLLVKEGDGSEGSDIANSTDYSVQLKLRLE